MRILLTALVIFFTVSPALAHKIRVFAYQEGAYVVTESRFSGGRAAQGAEVTAMVDDQVISAGRTDTLGGYQFLLPQKLTDAPANIDIVTTTGDGHKAHWTLLAEDIHAPQVTQPAAPSNTPAVASIKHSTMHPMSSPLTEAAIRTIIQEELAKGLAPINRELSEKKPSLQDILGGLGYIFGLLGIASFFTSRRK